MPNGGPDNCATCIYNLAFDKETGWQNTDGDSHCVLRNLGSSSPFYTYCANQNFHNTRAAVDPVGPVYQAAGGSHTRVVWMDSPDTPKIREALLYLLSDIDMGKLDEFPTTTKFEQEVVRQLMFFVEPAAADGLRQIITAPLDLDSDPGGQVESLQLPLVGIAVEALAAIVHDAFLQSIPDDYLRPHVRYWHADALPDEVMRLLPEDFDGSAHDGSVDVTAVVRYHVARGLRFCTGTEAASRLLALAKDPDKTVAAMAGLVGTSGFDKEQAPYGLPRYEEFWLFNDPQETT